MTTPKKTHAQTSVTISHLTDMSMSTSVFCPTTTTVCAVRFTLVAIVAFVLMEPITYALHRWVMHGFGLRLHRSHHLNAARVEPSRVELNDLYPVIFAGAVIGAFALGFNASQLSILVPICIGVTAYGVVYAFVHDLVIHRRLGSRVGGRSRALGHLARAHKTHHVTNGEPYGMLAPYALRAISKGLRPSHRPTAS